MSVPFAVPVASLTGGALANAGLLLPDGAPTTVCLTGRAL
jgi:hypothetical protein